MVLKTTSCHPPYWRLFAKQIHGKPKQVKVEVLKLQSLMEKASKFNFVSLYVIQFITSDVYEVVKRVVPVQK